MFYPVSRSCGRVFRTTVIYLVYPATATTTMVAKGLNKDTSDLAACALLSGVLTTVTIPLVFPLIRPRASIAFNVTFLGVLDGIFPLLLTPFFVTLLFHCCVPQLRGFLLGCRASTFCL